MRLILVALLPIVVLGCRTNPALETPATYIGVVPCADCPGIRMTLTLHPDSTYRLRNTYLAAEAGRDRHVSGSGRWMMSADGKRITLREGGPAPNKGLPIEREVAHLVLVAPDRLRLLDREGRPIETRQDATLSRADNVDPIDDHARVDDHPRVEETRWRLAWLAGSATAPGREAWIRLAPNERRATGSTGCNQMGGSYRLAGDSLVFEPMAMTKMACPGMGDQESVFTRALEATRRYAMKGDTLELLDGSGRAVARLVRSEG